MRDAEPMPTGANAPARKAKGGDLPPPHSGAVGIWSTDYSTTTGQALVTRRVAERILPALGNTRRYVFPAGSSGKALASWFRAVLRLWADLFRGQIALLYLVSSRSNAGFLRDLPALLAARVAGVQVCAHVHGSDIVDLLTARWLSPLARWVYRGVKVILPSQHLVAPLASASVVKVEVCENFFQPPAPGTGLKRNDQRLHILWNSNIMASKGFFTLYQAVEALGSENLPVRLTVLGLPVGDHEMPMGMIEDTVRLLKAKGLAQFVGLVPPQEANAWLDQADVVALPSRYASECQPLSLIAAMCAGTAIIAADGPALRATLQDYPAEFVDAHSVTEIMAAIRRIQQALPDHRRDRQENKGRLASGAEHARRRFSAERFDERMMAVLGEPAATARKTA